LNLGPPALAASTIPLGYRGGSDNVNVLLCLPFIIKGIRTPSTT